MNFLRIFTLAGIILGGLPAPSGAQTFPGICGSGGAFVWVSGSFQCSTSTGATIHFGAPGIIEPTDFWVARPGVVAGTILQMQDGKSGNLRTLTGASAAGLNLQSLVDTTSSGNNYSALSMDVEGQAGTSGGIVGINILAQVNTAWVPGAGPLPGANAIEATGKSTKGGHVWGSDYTGWCITTACTELYGIEVNVRNDIAATAQASGIWLVNENSVVPTAGSAMLISGQASNVGFPTAGFYFSTVAGFYPLTTGATLLKTDAATIATGIDLSPLTISGNAFVSPSFSVSGSGAVAAGQGSFNSFVSAGVNSALTGQLRLLGSTSGTATITVPNAAGTPTLTIGSSSGTPAVTASLPLSIATATGNITLGTPGTPSIASGACGTGTNGSISGSNQSGIITIGAVATASCTVSFSATLPNAPGACLIFPGNAAAAATGTTVARVGTPSTSAWVITGTALASTVYSYICI